jgi:hypothetical protein
MYRSSCLVVDPWSLIFDFFFLLAKHIFEILRFQIETKRVFNLVGDLIILRCYHLQVENLDRIIRVTKKE